MKELTDEQNGRVEQKLAELRTRGWWTPDHEDGWRQWCRGQVLIEDMQDLERGFYTGLAEAAFWANGEHEDGFSEIRPDPNMGDLLELKFDLEKLLAVMTDIDDEGHIFTYGHRIVQGGYGPVFYLALWCSEALYSDSEKVEGDPRFDYTLRQTIDAYEEVAQEWQELMRPTN